MKKIKKVLLVIFAFILVLLIAAWWILTLYIYNDNINQRFETYEPLMLYISDYPGLKCDEYSFTSNKGQKLVGYLYSSGENQRGIVVLAHGFGGGGHNSYMDVCDYFAENGYYVFTYDATGNDKSEGKGVGGVPQGVVDLDYAISFVEKSGNFEKLPIVLYGHSWGGYSVCNVLKFHPEVKAVIECSGCNKSSDLIEIGGKEIIGNLVYTMMPFVYLHEFIHYGKYAETSAMDAFKATTCPVMVVHSSDDDLVPIEYGYDKFFAVYKDDPRFTFMRFEDKGHNDIVNDKNNTYMSDFEADYKQWTENLDYDYRAKENRKRFAWEKASYYHEHLDREKYSHRLDTELMNQFVKFYDSACR